MGYLVFGDILFPANRVRGDAGSSMFSKLYQGVQAKRDPRAGYYLPERTSVIIQCGNEANMEAISTFKYAIFVSTVAGV